MQGGFIEHIDVDKRHNRQTYDADDGHMGEGFPPFNFSFDEQINERADNEKEQKEIGGAVTVSGQSEDKRRKKHPPRDVFRPAPQSADKSRKREARERDWIPAPSGTSSNARD